MINRCLSGGTFAVGYSLPAACRLLVPWLFCGELLDEFADHGLFIAASG